MDAARRTWLATLLGGALAGSATAQVEWQGRAGRSAHGMVYDTVASRLVMFGGESPSGAALQDTWENTGAAWSEIGSAAFPEVSQFAYAYHPGLGGAVAFGGINSSSQPTNTTWVFNGNSWGHHNFPLAPSPRHSSAMCYDSARQRIVLYGGIDGSNNWLSDTWEFDGTQWQYVQVVGPTPLAHHAMAFDPARNRVVMCYYSAGFGGTFEYDATSWSSAPFLPVPGPRENLAMATDPSGSGVLIFGGWDTFNGNIYSDELWRWDGIQYSLQTPPAGSDRPFGRQLATMTLNPVNGRVVLQGGRLNANTVFADTWEWDGVRWHSAAGNSPSPRNGASMAYDESRSEIVLVGGEYYFTGFSHFATDDTWVYGGGLWQAVAPPQAGTAIAAPYLHAMAYDAANGEVVLFGGVETDETWLRTNGAWSLATPANTPPPRFGHAMVYDRTRQRVVLFGGGQGFVPGSWAANGSTFDDTWEWDGSNWTQIPVGAIRPPQRINHGMAYDESVQRVVLFGGHVGPVFGGLTWRDTWEWDGQAWQQRFPTTVPPGRFFCTMAYDVARKRTVLAPDWEWSGVDWVQRQPATLPTDFGSMAYDRLSDRMVWFGGGVFGWRYGGETWEFGPTQPASYTTFGSGCQGSIGLPRLSRIGSGPWLGETFELLLDGVTQAPGFLAFGFDDTSWLGLTLPLELSGFALPGCWLYTDLAVIWQVVPGTVAIPVPNVSSALGLTIYNQAAFVDFQANAGGLVLSNAGEGVLGGL